MARLNISSSKGERGMLELTKSVITIGRGSANDLVLNDPSVSRFHAVIKQLENDIVTIADRSSTNGVLINGKRIEHETPLNSDDRAVIGIFTLHFEQVDEARMIIQPVRVPSGVNEVLGGSAYPAKPKSEVPSDTNKSELLERFRRLERENYLLKVLYDAGKALNSKLSLEDVTQQVMDLAFRIDGVERGFMLLLDKDGRVLRQTSVKYRQPANRENDSGAPSIIFSQTILERLKEELQPILITDPSADVRFSGSESLRMSGLRSAMCAPLMGGNRLFGVIYVDNLQKTSAFTEEELSVFALVAAQAAAAIDNTLAHQQLAEGAIQRSALERFLSPDVVELIAANPEGVRLGGTNQKVSVLFADIRGFTSLSEKMAPERVVEVLNEYFTRVTDVIFDNGGTLDKYIGDGVMAVFGAPISKGNDALNAVRAAVDLKRMLVEMNREGAEKSFPVLRVGIGINTGIVTAGNIGSPRRLDYTVIGDTVNIAARLMANAAPGQIVVSAETAAELGVVFPLTPLPPLMVKGKTNPLNAFEVDWHEKRRKSPTPDP